MSKPTNRTTRNSFGRLFGGLFARECATLCEAYSACGGSRESAPCGCAWLASSGKRHKCEECSLVCRERRKAGLNGLEPDFTPHVNAGSLLEQAMVRQNSTMQYPLFIPTNTQNLKGMELPLRWAAADIKTLFNVRNPKPYFATRQSTQQYLQVGSDCKLIAVLNGKDSALENFWAMKRRTVLEQLQSSGFSVGTGATYSVNDLTEDGTPMPYSHNAAMLMRHHQVVREIQAAGMESIPNLYWVDGDPREQKHWTEWLMLNTQIHTVSRDFSSTRKTEVVMNKLYELISLLNKAGRSFHVLIVGTGCNTAPLVLQELAKAGHSGSIVTGAPVHAARYNMMYRLDYNGRIVDEQLPNQTMPFPDLMWHNMEIFERALFKAVAGSGAEQKALPNVLSSGF